jgi:hypothetical protein
MALWSHLLIWNAVAGAAGRCARRTAAEVRALTGHRRWLLPLLAVAAALGIAPSSAIFWRAILRPVFYLLVGIKFIEARNTRDGALDLLALFLSLTQFFYLQTITAALSAYRSCSPSAAPWPRCAVDSRGRFRLAST